MLAASLFLAWLARRRLSSINNNPQSRNPHEHTRPLFKRENGCGVLDCSRPLRGGGGRAPVGPLDQNHCYAIMRLRNAFTVDHMCPNVDDEMVVSWYTPPGHGIRVLKNAASCGIRLPQRSIVVLSARAVPDFTGCLIKGKMTLLKRLQTEGNPGVALRISMQPSPPR